MENASKALIIAGEVLIAIIILSILTAVIVSFGNYSSDMHKKIADQEVYQFNSNFLSYAGRNNITAQEVATIINFAKKENDKNNFSRKDNSSAYINVVVGKKNFFKQTLTEDIQYDDNSKFNVEVNKFIKNNNTKFYSCLGENIEYNKETNRVNKIVFIMVNP